MVRKITLFLLASLCATLTFGQPIKNILLEKITSAGCPGCPDAALLLKDLVANDSSIIPVAIHLDDQFHKDQMATLKGDSILRDYYWATPTGMVDRVHFSGNEAMTHNSWNFRIGQRQNDSVQVTVAANTTYSPVTRQLSIDLSAQFLADVSGDFRVNAYVLEDHVTGTGVGYDQKNGYHNQAGHPLQGLGNPILNYVHRWVLRDILADDPMGQMGVLPGTITAGQSFAHTFQTTLDTAWDDTETSVIVMLQRHHADLISREIMNCASLGLNASILSDLSVPTQEAQVPYLYPNPAQGMTRLFLPVAIQGQHVSFDLFNLQGQKVLGLNEVAAGAVLPIHNLTPGIYAWKITQADQLLSTGKLVVE